MKSIINESDISYFLKSHTVTDVELYLNSVVLLSKHMDMITGEKKSYAVKLFDKKPQGILSYKVDSNAVGKECLRVLSRSHNIENAGSESDKSVYVSYYTK